MEELEKDKNMNGKVDDELTYRIIGCVMKVHNTLGNGFQEVIYQRCLAIELEKGLLFNFGATSLEVKRLFRKH